VALREVLEGLARQPSARVWLGKVPIHGAKLRRLLRALPADYEVESSPCGDRLLFRWQTPERRGALSLRAVADPELGSAVQEALARCQQLARLRSRSVDWTVNQLPEQEWSAVRGIFGPKKYARQSAAEAVERIVAHGWRNHRKV